MKAHYMRTSTKGQNLDRQFTDSGNEVITGYQRFKEDGVSGTILFAERPKAKQLIELIEAGEITEVYVHSIDRLGRNTSDVLNTVKYFTSKRVNLISKQEGLRTIQEDGKDNPMASLIVGILSTLSEWDYNRRRTNAQEGIDIRKAQGKYLGRVKGSGMSDEAYLKKHRKCANLLLDKMSLRNSAKLSDVSLSTAQKVKRILQDKGQLA